MSNPFNMIDGTIQGRPVTLRPVQFDDHEYNKDFIRANGQLIRPTMAVTTCPVCSQLVEQPIGVDVDLSKTMRVHCVTCEPAIVTPIFPFRDPIATGILTLFKVNATALSSLNVLFAPKQVVDVPAAKTPQADSDMVERRSGGLGQFIRRRDQWKKLTKAIDGQLGPVAPITTNRNDLFDLMGSMMDNTTVGAPLDVMITEDMSGESTGKLNT